VANRTVAHLHNLAGRAGTIGSWSIERSKKTEDIRAEELYARLQPYILSEEQLCSNSFPRPDPRGRPGFAHLVHIHDREKAMITPAGAAVRQCLRCNKMYDVGEDGAQKVADECSYHWRKTYVRRGQEKHGCCDQVSPAVACCLGDYHVSNNFDPDHLAGYMATLDKPEPLDGNHGAFALDCEMCYTTMGCELTRITVIDEAGNTVYETLVLPDNPIIDYNTRFSGITDKDMQGVETTIRDVQAVLLNLFSSKTILIGHSLESDFKALKLIHNTVVDTSVVFPHRLGPPRKQALRALAQDHLSRLIQNDVGGHDSAEDAVTCMDLMLFRLKEDAKLRQ